MSRPLAFFPPARLSKRLTFNFCIFICSPWSHWLCFFQPISSCSFLAIFLASVDFAHSFVIPGTSDIEQSYGSNQRWTPSPASTTASTVQGSWPRTGLRQPPPARLLLFIQARAVHQVPWLTVFHIFLCLVICSPSSVMNLFHRCPFGHVDLPWKVGSCFIIYGSCPVMVSSNRVTSF